MPTFTLNTSASSVHKLKDVTNAYRALPADTSTGQRICEIDKVQAAYAEVHAHREFHDQALTADEAAEVAQVALVKANLVQSTAPQDEATLVGIQNTLQTLSTQLGLFQNNVNTRFDHVNTRFDQINTRLDGLDTRLGDVERRVTASNANHKARAQNQLRSTQNDPTMSGTT